MPTTAYTILRTSLNSASLFHTSMHQNVKGLKIGSPHLNTEHSKKIEQVPLRKSLLLNVIKLCAGGVQLGLFTRLALVYIGLMKPSLK
jgi:hypothetical protein